MKRNLKDIFIVPPIAMVDESGNLVTSSKALETLTIKMYQDRHKGVKIKDSQSCMKCKVKIYSMRDLKKHVKTKHYHC